jgi:4-diphosphocytidyl-2-C-methyl-D-erythritol kinase
VSVLDELKIKARAKINLSLDVVDKREDGYHELEMVMQQIDLYDVLTFKKSDDIIIACDNPYVPNDERNIVHKIVEKVQTYKNIKKGLTIHIEKNIPVSAGLGGGSTDAAATLVAYNRLYDLKLTREEMIDISKAIGADIPFFFYGGCCLAKGIGEKLTPIQGFNKGWLVISKPNIGISTKEVYGDLDYRLIVDHPETDQMIAAVNQDNIYQIAKYLSNVLEPVVFKRQIIVEKIKNKMSDYGALGALMSGSGPSVFGIFKDYDAGKNAYRNLKKVYNETYLIKTYNGGNYEFE